MKNLKKQPAPFAIFTGCTDWSEDSARWLAEATFLSIEPHGSVFLNSGSESHVVVDVYSAFEWCIVAHFPHEPPSIAASFVMKDRDLAFAAALEVKGSRPLFYITAHSEFVIDGDTVDEIISYVRNWDEEIDNIHGKE